MHELDIPSGVRDGVYEPMQMEGIQSEPDLRERVSASWPVVSDPVGRCTADIRRWRRVSSSPLIWCPDRLGPTSGGSEGARCVGELLYTTLCSSESRSRGCASSDAWQQNEHHCLVEYVVSSFGSQSSLQACKESSLNHKTSE
jgi:hypothetical protein